MGVVHYLQNNPTDVVLAGYRTRIIAEVDGVALRVGRLLREAREECPHDFNRWVETDLPFGMETARRLIAISAAYEKLPAETLRGLPRPWQALYALKELSGERLAEAVSAGTVMPEMTVEAAKEFARAERESFNRSPHAPRQTFSQAFANRAAGRLMRCEAADLKSRVRDDLRAWLGCG